MNRYASPEGRALKATAAALQLLQRATAIRGELRLTSAAFKDPQRYYGVIQSLLITAAKAAVICPTLGGYALRRALSSNR
ncbi:hypothetical protein [Microbulbifer epialgicus]|uniref:Uncharacterized protein n=1 Tax=Microbulbifer epialgicus TaxID=393907 RepID=A0ABV4NY93_9GAMM